MISYLDKLNLRPAEKRLVVLAVLALFIVINLIFIVPQFGEWGRLEKDMREMRGRMGKYSVELNKQTYYKKEIERLRRVGQVVAVEDQKLELASKIDSLAAISGVFIQGKNITDRQSTSGGKTNLFFKEQTATVNANATEQQLVDFLYLLGSGDSLIRAKVMNLQRDQTGMRLKADLTLVASYPNREEKKTALPPAKGANTNAPTAPQASPFKPAPTLPRTNLPPRFNTNGLPTAATLPKPK